VTSLLGILAGLGVIVGASLADGDPISALFSTTATIIVFGGTFTALLTQFGLGHVMAGLGRFMWLIKPPKSDITAFIDRVAEWSNLSRSQGALALEGAMKDVKDPFERKGLQMIIDNTPLDDLHPILSILAENAARDERIGGEVFEAAGGYSPTIGVMGAVLGLIHVMMRLDHPEELGAGIATAFVATIYGVGGANLIFLPLGTNLTALAEAREREREIIIQGFMLLAAGKPGIVIRQNLLSFLSDKKKPQKRRAEDGAETEAELSEQAA
jgi:chemotaxis protein MotA